MTRRVVAKAGDLPEGAKLRVTAGGRDFRLVSLGGEHHALADRCPHAGGALSEGRISGIVTSDGPGDYQLRRQGELIKRPWRGWEFDIRTGQSWCDPKSTRARSFETETIGGEELLRGPFVAETATVTIDGLYIVIDC